MRKDLSNLPIESKYDARQVRLQKEFSDLFFSFKTENKLSPTESLTLLSREMEDILKWCRRTESKDYE